MSYVSYAFFIKPSLFPYHADSRDLNGMDWLFELALIDWVEV
ncbi:MAG: hypothetical protein WCT04_07695 [Planctomycetota bacterium]